MVSGIENSTDSPLLFSDSNCAISSFKILFNSLVVLYLSLATLSSILLIIFIVVLTPTSLVINTSSSSSNTLASIFDFPVTSLFNLDKNEVLLFSKPLSNVSFFFLEKILLKKFLSAKEQTDKHIKSILFLKILFYSVLLVIQSYPRFSNS